MVVVYEACACSKSPWLDCAAADKSVFSSSASNCPFLTRLPRCTWNFFTVEVIFGCTVACSSGKTTASAKTVCSIEPRAAALVCTLTTDSFSFSVPLHPLSAHEAANRITTRSQSRPCIEFGIEFLGSCEHSRERLQVRQGYSVSHRAVLVRRVSGGKGGLRIHYLQNRGLTIPVPKCYQTQALTSQV